MAIIIITGLKFVVMINTFSFFVKKCKWVSKHLLTMLPYYYKDKPNYCCSFVTTKCYCSP